MDPTNKSPDLADLFTEDPDYPAHEDVGGAPICAGNGRAYPHFWASIATHKSEENEAVPDVVKDRIWYDK